MTDRHITAEITDSATGEVNNLVIDTETGQYVGTEEVDSDTAQLLDMFAAVSGELNGEGTGNPEVEAIADRCRQWMSDNPDFGQEGTENTDE